MRHGRLLTKTLLLAATVTGSVCAHAQSSWDLVLNGRAVHVNAEHRWNENNYGVGVEREFDSARRWVKVAMANGFRDSTDRVSLMAGGGIKRRFRATRELHVDVGVVGFVMTRRDVHHNQPFPGALPAVSIGTDRIALNVTYIPGPALDMVGTRKQDPSMSGVFFLQLKLDASLLGFGHGRRSLFADSGE